MKAAGAAAAELEAQVLLAKILGKSRAQLLAAFEEPFPPSFFPALKDLLGRRAAGYPLQYLTGVQEFMSLPFFVNEKVAIPRADTECVVETCLFCLRDFSCPVIVDVGTGSGAIGLSLIWYRRDSFLYATDISPEALAVAALNAQHLGLTERAAFLGGDLLVPFLEKERKVYFDLVVSNPPYIPHGEIKQLPREVKYEPQQAFDGGPNGLASYRTLVPQAAQVLKQGGYLVLEVGSNQAEAVKEIIQRHGFQTPEVGKDGGNRDRVVWAKK